MSDFNTGCVVHFRAVVREETISVPRPGILGRVFGFKVTKKADVLVFDEPICGDKELYFKPGALKARYGVEPGDRIQGLACVDPVLNKYDIGNIGIAQLSIGRPRDDGP